ncbi:Hypothetical predicted protein [Cloeon dipterum]|uniref:Uncharacterized protein n=1 Tax=Cloeon dipterum TaxID=197152 RepID=A0A8S1CFU9_9INSE|nr:Hypothetical predicted protein [Cloeon dipterum]
MQNITLHSKAPLRAVGQNFGVEGSDGVMEPPEGLEASHGSRFPSLRQSDGGKRPPGERTPVGCDTAIQQCRTPAASPHGRAVGRTSSPEEALGAMPKRATNFVPNRSLSDPAHSGRLLGNASSEVVQAWKAKTGQCSSLGFPGNRARLTDIDFLSATPIFSKIIKRHMSFCQEWDSRQGVN